MTYIALTIGGSDSSGGAGIQADLKTFAALGVYGCTVITSITAQNTMEISRIDPLSSEIIEKQILSIINDIYPNAIKVGMVYNKPAIDSIRRLLKSAKCPIVLDPIVYATNRKILLQTNAMENFISTLVPISTVITPNLLEAEKITGMPIRSEKDIVISAKEIKRLGAKNVIIKGGHMTGKVFTDFLLQQDGELVKISKERINVKNTHGSGCIFSAAITALLAQKFTLKEAFEIANVEVRKSFKSPLTIGRGLVVTDPISLLYSDALRYDILQKTQHAVNEIESLTDFGVLMPETQSNIVFALPGAKDIADVAGVRGRIVRVGNMAKALSHVQFGASLHTARAIIAYHSSNPSIRSAMNIRFDNKMLKICSSHFEISYYDRRYEPKNIKHQEGKTVQWGVTTALRKKPDAEIIYHRGDVGKEPMTIVFGSEPMNVIDKLKIVLKEYQRK